MSDKVLLGMPLGSDPCAETIFCKDATDGDFDVAYRKGSLVSDNRDKLAEKAIKEKYDWLWFVDSDMTFPRYTLSKLLAHNDPVVTALCFRRVADYEPCIYKRVTRDGATYEEDITRDYIKIEGCGSAMMLISTNVLQAVFRKYKTCFHPFDGLGEDISFCLRLKEMGIPIYCDTTIPIGHVGTKVYGIDDWIKTRQNRKAMLCHEYCKFYGLSEDKCDDCPLQKM